ncbi:MAG: helix-turn-helix transcriptional regulator [Thiobacillus sp.]|nr:helix-turn-helix transcriptional regulator [Thiobacillus sp.]
MEMDWSNAIKELAEKRGWSIRQLAGDLGVSQQYLNDVAKGAKPASPMLRFKLLGRMGYDISFEYFMLLLPDDVATAVREWDAQGKKTLAKKADKKTTNRKDVDQEAN